MFSYSDCLFFATVLKFLPYVMVNLCGRVCVCLKRQSRFPNNVTLLLGNGAIIIGLSANTKNLLADCIVATEKRP